MKEDVENVVLLGRSLLDYLPQPRQPSSTLGGTPGLSASREVPCETCGARGRVVRSQPCAGCQPRLGYNRPPVNRPKHGCSPCLICDGTGWRKGRKREVEDAPWDAYAGTPVASEEQQSERKRWEDLRDLERRLAHTTRLLALWEGLDTVEETWEEVRQAMWRTGSYHELLRAMSLQARETPNRVSVFWHVIVLGEPVRLSGPAAVELMRTCSLLGDRMRLLLEGKPIKVPWHLRESAERAKESLWRGRTRRHGEKREERNARIFHERHTLGWSLKKIANRHALTERRVKQILAAGPVASAA